MNSAHKVMDKNDNGPEFVFPSAQNSTVYLSSYAPPDHVITQVRAHDADAGDNGHVTYRVIDSQVDSFRLDSESGSVVVARHLDNIDHRTFRLTIHAVDHGVPARYRHTFVISFSQCC